jgi:hypothetical protein
MKKYIILVLFVLGIGAELTAQTKKEVYQPNWESIRANYKVAE